MGPQIPGLSAGKSLDWTQAPPIFQVQQNHCPLAPGLAHGGLLPFSQSQPCSLVSPGHTGAAPDTRLTALQEEGRQAMQPLLPLPLPLPPQS